MSVVSEIERIKNEVNSQSEVIDEIITILDSKAGSNPKLQEKAVIPSTVQKEVVPDAEYDGLSKVTVNGDSNLVPENIKNGVSIFGVTGSNEGESINSIDYSSNVYNTTAISYYDKTGTYITKEVDNIGDINLNNIDFTKRITFNTNADDRFGYELEIKIINGAIEAAIFKRGAAP